MGRDKKPRTSGSRVRANKKGTEVESTPLPSRHAVLLVEDNPTTRRVVRLILEQHGLSVLEASDGNSALRLMELERPRLVLQDLVLPDIDGFDLVGELRNRAGNTQVSILAFSGCLAATDTERIRAAGFDDIITKPIDGNRLVSILEAHLLLTAPTAERFGAGRRVVVAESDPLQLRITRLRLERLGFRVRSASDGVQALEIARRVKPDVLIADLMMPRLDGLGLSLLLRQERELRALTIVLVTSQNVDEPDREHARRSGANRLVQRTPDLKELIQALKGSTLAPEAPLRVMPEALLGLEQERSRRLLLQLERQIELNHRIARRCSSLAAELTVLSGISETVIRSGNLDAALDEALATCLDAGGISAGALYLLDADGSFRVRTLGALPGSERELVRTFFGHADLLRWIINGGRVVEVPSRELPTDVSIDILQKSGATHILVAPLNWRERAVGSLVLLARRRELDQENWRAFAQGVANHITQALALADAFEKKESAERDAREHASLLRAVLDAISEGVIVADPQGQFLVWNAAAENILGKCADNLPAEDWSERYGVYSADLKSFLPTQELPLVRAMRGESVENVEFHIRPPGVNSCRTIQASARPTFYENGQLSGGVAVFRDATEQRRAEAQLVLSERLASMGMLTASIAHEINDPLSAVLSNLELALGELDELGRRHPLAKELSEELETVRGGAERIRQLANDHRFFSQAEEDELRLVW